MLFINKMKIGSKLTFIIVFFFIIIIFLINFFIGFRVNKMSQKDVKAIAEESANHYANVVKAQLEVALDEARSLADFFETVAISDNISLSRDNVNTILKDFIEKNKNFLGTYVCFERNAFDGKDIEFMGSLGHDDTGRFIPYWTRDSSGKGVLEPLMDYEKEGVGDYYQIPKKSNKESVIEPYIYPIQGIDVLITSLVVPIHDKNGNFIGIFGIDLTLSSLQELILKTKVGSYKDAYLNFYSSNGIVVGSKNVDTVGENIVNITKNTELIENVKKNDSFMMIRKSDILNKDIISYGTAIEIGETETKWVVAVNIPVSEIYKEANSLILYIVIIGIISIIVLFIIVLITARSISIPLKIVTEGAKRFSIGDIELKGIDIKDMEKINNRKDELGDIEGVSGADKISRR